MKLLNKKGGAILLAMLLTAGLFLVANPAKADCSFVSTVGSPLSCAVLYFQGIIMGFIGGAMALVADWLGIFLKFQGQFFEDVAIVKTSWTIFRDFANMFFILILIIMAFATIFDVQKYKQYDVRNLMATFIIAALLINFSLAIGGFLIQVSTTLSNVMLNQFSDITGNLAGGFGLTKLADAMSGKGVDGRIVNLGDPGALALGTSISFIGIIIVASITLLSLLSAFIFAVIRVPVLWALLIISPLAWIAGILPNTRKYHQDWWKYFIGWTFFLPMYLFALVMGVAILQGRPDLEAAGLLGGKDALTAGLNFFGFGVQDIFYWGLTVIILVGGLAMSLKASFLAGTGVTKTFGAVSGTLNNWAKRRAYIPAIQKAGGEKLKEIKETGLPGRLGAFYGGERAERLRAAKVAGVLGKREALSEAQAGEVQKDYARLKGQNLTKEEMDTMFVKLQGVTNIKDQRIYEKFALAKLRAENGWVAEGKEGTKEMENIILRAGENSKFAQEYISALKKSNFSEALASQAEAEDFARSTTVSSLKKAVLETMAKNKQIIDEDLAIMALQLVEKDSKDVKDAMEKGIEDNIKNIKGARTKGERAAYLLDSTKNKELRRILAMKMSEDREITNYQKYKAAVDLFEGEDELESREMLSKIAKDKPLAHADILFRKKLGESEPDTLRVDYDPLSPTETTPAREAAFIGQVREKSKLPKMSAKAIVEADPNIWSSSAFETALWQHIESKEKSEPTKTVRGGKEKVGEGKRLILRMRQALQDSPDPDKEAVVKRLSERLEKEYPPIRLVPKRTLP